MEEKDNLFNDEARGFLFNFMKTDKNDIYVSESGSDYYIYLDGHHYTMVTREGKVKEEVPLWFKVEVFTYKLYMIIRNIIIRKG